MSVGKFQETNVSAKTFKTSFTSSTSSQFSINHDEEVLKVQVGRGVTSYLEQCFRTDVSVLNTEKIKAIPEFQWSDLNIVGHLGRGVYSDVFEVGAVVPVLEHLNVLFCADAKNTLVRWLKSGKARLPLTLLHLVSNPIGC